MADAIANQVMQCNFANTFDVRGSYFMACVESVKNKHTKESFPDELDIGKRVSNEAEKLGLIVRSIGNCNILSPPLILNERDCDFIVKTLGESIIKAGDEIKQQGYW